MCWPAVLAVLAAPAGCGARAASGPSRGLPGGRAGEGSAGASPPPRYIPHAVAPHDRDLLDRHHLTAQRFGAPPSIVAAGGPRRVSP